MKRVAVQAGCCKIYVNMAKKRYTLYFTDVTHSIINSLEKREYNIRNVLNAGIVLFDQTDAPKRGEAVAIAHGMLKEEIEVALARLRNTLTWMESIKQSDVFSTEERELANKLQQILRIADNNLTSSDISDSNLAESHVDESLKTEATKKRKTSSKSSKAV